MRDEQTGTISSRSSEMDLGAICQIPRGGEGPSPIIAGGTTRALYGGKRYRSNRRGQRQPGPVDIGTENINRASELSSQALREAFSESAKRAVDMAQVNLQRAQQDVETAQQFAKTVNDYADRMCADLEAGFARAAQMTENMARTLSMIAAKTSE